MKKSLSVPVLALTALLLSACNTIEGVGRDVQAGGEAVEDVARDTREEITQ